MQPMATRCRRWRVPLNTGTTDGDEAEHGDGEGVDGRLPEHPGDVGVQRGGSATGDEARRAAVAQVDVRDDHDAGQHRQVDDPHGGRHEGRPGEQRHPPEGHARRAERDDRRGDADPRHDQGDQDEQEGQREQAHAVRVVAEGATVDGIGRRRPVPHRAGRSTPPRRLPAGRRSWRRRPGAARSAWRRRS